MHHGAARLATEVTDRRWQAIRAFLELHRTPSILHSDNKPGRLCVNYPGTCLLENYNSQGESRLLPRLPFLLLQWSGMNKCCAELECENIMPYKSRKHAYRKTYESLGEHLDFL